MNESTEVGLSDAGVAPSPLRGKNIVVTRAVAQSFQITAELETLGATVIHCPTIEIVPPSSWAPVDDAIARIDGYDWIIFTSANGVDFFFGRLGERLSDSKSALARNAVVAIGPATASALQREGITARIVATSSRAEGALQAIIDHLGDENRVAELSFLIPQAKVSREALANGLRKLGARVDAVETYQTIKPDIDGAGIVRLFEESAVDAITFTSPSTVSNFSALVGRGRLSELLSNTVVACIGPVTAEAAAEHGLKRIVLPSSYNSAALVQAIVGALEKG